MILITEVKTVTVDKNEVEIAHYENRPYVHGISGGSYWPIQMKAYYEYVRGERFINTRGEEVYLGMTAQVQEALGLPFSVFKDLNDRLERYRKKFRILSNDIELLEHNLGAVRKDLQIYKTMKFIDRLKFLFGIVK